MRRHLSDNRFLKYLLNILVPVMVLTLVFFLLTSNTIVRLATNNMSRQSQDNAALVDNYMSDVVRSMEDVRGLCETNCSTDEEVKTFVRSTEHYGVYGGVYTGDNTGFYVGSTPWDIPDDYDPTTRPWYIDGKDSRDFVFGEPYLDASVSKVCVSVSARMDADDDDIVRVVAADIYLDYMDELAKSIVDSSDIEGALIVTKNGEMIVADSSGQCAGLAMSETSDFIREIQTEVLVKGSGQYKMKSDKNMYYIDIREVDTTGWYLIVFEKSQTILADLYEAELIMGFVAIVVTLTLIFVMRRYGREVSLVEQQANNAKTEFISRISHDIRTPIGQVLNLTCFAKQDKDDPVKLEEDLNRIDSSGRFLLSLINDVLDVSQIESGLMEIRPNVTTYKAYLDDIRNLMVPMCENKGLTCEIVEVEHPEDMPALLCDDVRLKQITLNLISNAVKYTPTGGKVSYISETKVLDDSHVEYGYSIQDTGVGMTRSFMNHMFEKFTRDTDNELRDSSQMSSGLGLYLVKNMIDLMGGTITYESEVGQGTRVSVRIPLEINTTDTQSDDTETAATNEDLVYSGRALLVDDNELNLEIAMRMIEDIGLEVDNACDGQDAVDKFSASDPGYYQIIFMDIQMPKLNGYEATRAIRALDRPDARSIPIVAMTADAFKDAMDASKASGMNGFITKPLDIDEICGALEKFGMAHKKD